MEAEVRRDPAAQAIEKQIDGLDDRKAKLRAQIQRAQDELEGMDERERKLRQALRAVIQIMNGGGEDAD
jgi:prefoldin subunit 5